MVNDESKLYQQHSPKAPLGQRNDIGGCHKDAQSPSSIAIAPSQALRNNSACSYKTTYYGLQFQFRLR